MLSWLPATALSRCKRAGALWHRPQRVGLIAGLLPTLLSLPAGADGAPQFFPSVKYPDYPFAEAVAYNGVLYLSGEIGADAQGKLVPGGIGPESRRALDNIRDTLDRHGLAMADIIKCTVFLADIAEWPTFNTVYATFFAAGRYPARSALAASGLALGARVEVECLAALPARKDGGGN